MKPIPREPNLPTPTNGFGKPYPIAQWYECPHCKKESPMVREWVGLTPEDKQRVIDNNFGGSRADCMDAAEKILREKNS